MIYRSRGPPQIVRPITMLHRVGYKLQASISDHGLETMQAVVHMGVGQQDEVALSMYVPLAPCNQARIRPEHDCDCAANSSGPKTRAKTNREDQP